MSHPLTESDIIFPHLSNTPNFSTTLSSLKRSALSITNRLTSITRDSEFVTSVAAAYSLPLVANERCGSWYIPPEQKAASVYFKSTDGHMGEWAFSLRRLNLQLLDVVGQSGGCVIVDSTRRGKSMPDALSKTVPFWCCVMNRAVFGGEREGEEALGLFTPPAAVSESENIQMERRIDGFVRQFLDICKPDIAALRSKLQKPLRPLWVTQASTLPHSTPEFTDFHPVILCTASRRVRGAEASEGGYIQGAADDHEAWSHGLTPGVFWHNKTLLLNTNEHDLPSTIASLAAQTEASPAASTLIAPTTTLYVSSSENTDFTPFTTVISCTPSPLPQPLLKSSNVRHYLHLPCGSGKLGSRDLRSQLSALHSLAAATEEKDTKTLICCPTGRDLSVGTALAYLCLFVGDDGSLQPKGGGRVDKTLLKRRLAWITTSNAALNPSRATLQSVNAALMSSQTYNQSTLSSPRDPALFTPEWRSIEPSPSPPPCMEHVQGQNQHRIFVRDIFTSLACTWDFTRVLTSTHPSQPSGRVVGSARFTPVDETTLLYSERGELSTEMGVRTEVERRWVYRLVTPCSGEAVVRVLFVDSGSRQVGAEGEGASGVFVDMAPLVSAAPASGGEEFVSFANLSPHLCGPDRYNVSWRFRGFEDGAWTGGWEVDVDVRGERKGYVSSTCYVRGDGCGIYDC